MKWVGRVEGARGQSKRRDEREGNKGHRKKAQCDEGRGEMGK